ncbi:hypothetical protein SSPO_007850 [Streptomyces antimycoticus]|uniref:Uncharacterized protein n=1 Tax=Streptomyces antimycoticus TaxID=68175 RepID=A0A499UVZ2_9ACTN|nr:hypothetical protein SSPO_007850 [Streptomyces antimycoticus]
MVQDTILTSAGLVPGHRGVRWPAPSADPQSYGPDGLRLRETRRKAVAVAAWGRRQVAGL